MSLNRIDFDLSKMARCFATFGVCVTLGFLTGCGSSKDSGGDSSEPAADETQKAAEVHTRNFEKLVALGPDGLALKIRSAFGLGLTSTVVNGAQVDYVLVNGTLFTGAISPDPNVKIPKKLASVSYFLALNGLADVVAKNYNIKLATGTAARNCTVIDDAKLIVQIVYPPVAEADRDQIAQTIVESCKLGVPETIRAIITSYPFALDTSI